MGINITKGLDYFEGRLSSISEIVPPFVFELGLRNGQTFYLHSISSRDEQTKSMAIRIWDLRAFTPQEIEYLKTKLNEVRSRKELQDERQIHSKLDWAILYINLSDISYCIEWHDRMWPEDDRDSHSPLGFNPE